MPVELERLPPPLVVALGAAAGTLIRWLVGEVATGIDDTTATTASAATTIATLGLNVVGSAAIGWLAGRGVSRPTWNLAAVGGAGGLTTFSGFAVDVARRLDDGQVAAASTLTASTLALAVTAAAAGYWWAKRWTRT